MNIVSVSYAHGVVWTRYLGTTCCRIGQENARTNLSLRLDYEQQSHRLRSDVVS